MLPYNIQHADAPWTGTVLTWHRTLVPNVRSYHPQYPAGFGVGLDALIRGFQVVPEHNAQVALGFNLLQYLTVDGVGKLYARISEMHDWTFWNVELHLPQWCPLRKNVSLRVRTRLKLRMRVKASTNPLPNPDLGLWTNVRELTTTC